MASRTLSPSAFTILSALAVFTGATLTIVKAWRVPITHDEAASVLWFTLGSYERVFTAYDANNHVLNTLLAKVGADLLGLSEFSVRLGALLGRLLFLTGVWVSSRQLLVSRPVRCAYVVVLSLNPYLLDMGMLSRGYSLGLGLAMIATCLGIDLARRRIAPAPQPLARAVCFRAAAFSFLMGLSASAVLVHLNGWCAAALMLAVLVLCRWWRTWQPRDALVLLRLGILALAPGILALAACYVRLLPLMDRDKFYVGLPTLSASLGSAFRPLFFYDNGVSSAHDGEWFAVAARIATPATTSAATLLLIALALAGLALRPRMRQRFVLGTFSLLLAVIAFQSLAMNMPWPVDRTVLYLVPWMIASVAISADLLATTVRARRVAMRRPDPGTVSAAAEIRPLRIVRLALAPVAIVFLAAQVLLVSRFTFRDTVLWTRSAAARPAMQRIAAECAAAPHPLPPNSVVLHGTWWIAMECEFYRRLYGLKCIQPVRGDLTRFPAGAQYYLLADEPGWGTPPPDLERIDHWKRYRMGLWRGAPLPTPPPPADAPGPTR